MKKSLPHLLEYASEYALCNGVHDLIHYRIRARHGHLPEPARTVALVWDAMALIENGGFRYLFENSCPGDPSFAKTAESFRRIGATQAHAAFVQAFGLFAGGEVPARARQRTAAYRSVKRGVRDEIDELFFAATDDVKSSLAQFIRAQAMELEVLLHARAPWWKFWRRSR